MDSISFLSLGDSYTKGECVEYSKSWPQQLIHALSLYHIKTNHHQVAETGWTTDELLDNIDEKSLLQSYDLISLQIGVNNQYRGYKTGDFEKDLQKLIHFCLQRSKRGPAGVFVLSIPDYGVMPSENHNEEKIKIEIEKYNMLSKSICTTAEIPFFDITDISRMSKNDSSLVAKDNLHPSEKMYKLWVDYILQDVLSLIKY